MITAARFLKRTDTLPNRLTVGPPRGDATGVLASPNRLNYNETQAQASAAVRGSRSPTSTSPPVRGCDTPSQPTQLQNVQMIPSLDLIPHNSRPAAGLQVAAATLLCLRVREHVYQGQLA